MIYLKQKIQELWKEFVDNEYQNMPVKTFCEKYQVCYMTCISIMWKKVRWSYVKRWQRSYVKEENERWLNTEKWVNKEHTYKIVWEFREIRWMKWLNLVKNSGYTIQH